MHNTLKNLLWRPGLPIVLIAAIELVKRLAANEQVSHIALAATVSHNAPSAGRR
jgi:hypothetical protein